MAKERPGYRGISVFVHQLRREFQYWDSSDKESNRDIFINILELYRVFSKNLNKLFTYHDIVCSMTLQSEVTLLDPFTHTFQDSKKIANFDFIRGNSTTEIEKVRIEETSCTLVAVGGKFLEKQAFKKVLKKMLPQKKYEKFFFYSRKKISPSMISFHNYILATPVLCS